MCVRATVCPSVCCVFMRVRGHQRVCVSASVWTCTCNAILLVILVLLYTVIVVIYYI